MEVGRLLRTFAVVLGFFAFLCDGAPAGNPETVSDWDWRYWLGWETRDRNRGGFLLVGNWGDSISVFKRF